MGRPCRYSNRAIRPRPEKHACEIPTCDIPPAPSSSIVSYASRESQRQRLTGCHEGDIQVLGKNGEDMGWRRSVTGQPRAVLFLVGIVDFESTHDGA